MTLDGCAWLFKLSGGLTPSSRQIQGRNFVLISRSDSSNNVNDRPFFVLPTSHKAIALSTSQPSRQQKSLPVVEKFALCPQSHICVLPAEVLSLIFSNLDIEDILRVKDTCIHFRNALQWGHREVFSYCQASEKFRKQYPATRKWQKWMVQMGLYPFTTTLSDIKSEVANTEHLAAKQWLRTLGKMMSTPRYYAREVYSRNYLHSRNLEVHFSPTNGNLLLCDLERDWVCVLGQNETGSWFEHRGSWQGAETEHIKPYSDREFQKAIFSTNGYHLYICCFRRGIQICRINPESPRWNETWGRTLFLLFDGRQLDISSSGKYLVILTEDHSIQSIQYINRDGCWVNMPMAKGLKIQPGILEIRFSPLDQHLVIDYIRQLMVLSLNSDGCWDLLLTIGKDIGAMDYQLNPSGKWLLIQSLGDFQGACYLEMVRLDPLQECGPRQRISFTYPPPVFSPAGNYLFKEGKNQCLLWRPDKSGQWVRYGGLTDPGAPLSPRPGQTEPDTFKFSPCDNYLLSSSTNGAVSIWGINELGKWTCRGTGQHNSKVSHIEFSQSGVHALTVDCFSIYIWGRDNCGLWSVKAIIPTDNVRHAHFHPAAEHLVVLRDEYRFRIWEMGENDSHESSVSPKE